MRIVPSNENYPALFDRLLNSTSTEQKAFLRGKNTHGALYSNYLLMINCMMSGKKWLDKLDAI
jgi:hypothetical protein